MPININAGAGSGTDTIAVASVNSFSGNVNFTCKAAAPVTCSIVSPVSLTAGSNGTSTLTVNAPANTPIGDYIVAVVGTERPPANSSTLSTSRQASMPSR